MPSNSVGLFSCPSLLSALLSGVAAGISSTGRGGLGQHGVAIGGPAPSGEPARAKGNCVTRCLVRVALEAAPVVAGGAQGAQGEGGGAAPGEPVAPKAEGMGPGP
jgi:hypothetical protein